MDIDYVGLLPELILAGTVIAVLLADLTPVPKHWTAALGLTGLFATAIPVLWLGLVDDAGPRAMFDGSYVVDEFALVMKGVFLIAGFVTLLLSVAYLESDRRYYEGEFYFLLLSSVAGAVVMASSRDLLTLFIGLELVTAPTFMLAGWRKGDIRSNEAALKFFVIGVASAAILAFGMSLVYGVTGHQTFAGIRDAIAAGTFDDAEPVFLIGVIFILLGFGFKVAAVPFHSWAPDTYQGAPTPVTAYLSVSSKAAGFVGLLLVCYLAFGEVRDIWGPAIWVIAVLSMTVGNLGALRQTNLVRLLGYSSIAQGGFILVPFAMAFSLDEAGLEEAFFATVTYLIIYLFMNVGAFAAVIAGSRKVGSAEMEDWAGLGSYAPALGGLMVLFFFALAGIPPLSGWFAKFVMFRAVLNDPGDVWAVVLAAIAAVNAVIAFYYYARVSKAVWFDPVPAAISPQEAAERRVAPALVLALGVSALVVLAMGFFPGLASFFGEAAALLAAAP